MDGDLEVGVFDVDGEHPIASLDRPQNRLYFLYLELGQGDEAIEGG